MLVESAITNIQAMCDAPDSDAIDWLDLTWLECRRRFARKITRSGAEVRILLRLRQFLKHGDVLGHWPDGRVVIVNVIPTLVLVIHPRSIEESCTAAFQIGNLHIPIEVISEGLLVPSSSQMQAMLAKYKIPFETQTRRFHPTDWPDAVQLSPDLRVIRSRP